MAGPVLLVVAGTFVGLAGAEGLLQLTSYRGLLFIRSFPSGYHVAVAGGFDIKPNVAPVKHRIFETSNDVWSNNVGCFDRPYAGEQPYLLLLGDSFTWGYAPFEDKWGTRLEAYLGTRVLKCGVGGYGTRQELLKARRLLSTLPAPQALVVGYFANDPGDDRGADLIVLDGDLIQDPGTTTDPARLREIRDRTMALLEKYCTSYEPAHPALQRLKCVLRKHSIVYTLAISAAKHSLSTTFLRRVGIVNTVPPTVRQVVPSSDDKPRHFQNVLDIKRLADSKAIPLLFVMIPSEEMVASHVASDEYSDVESFMNAHGISYYDPLPDFRSVAEATGIRLYWRSDPHLNVKGNHLLGLLVARRFLTAPEDVGRRSQVEKDLQIEFSYKGR